MPGLQRLTQFQFDATDRVIADLGKTKLQMRRKPLGAHGITGGIKVDDDVGEVLLDKVRQQKPIV
ncbi:hypothetical protein D3C87_1993890 [compost metagenome]